MDKRKKGKKGVFLKVLYLVFWNFLRLLKKHPQKIPLVVMVLFLFALLVLWS